MADLTDERDRIAEKLETLAASHPEERHKDTEQARDAFEQFGVSGVLADALWGLSCVHGEHTKSTRPNRRRS